MVVTVVVGALKETGTGGIILTLESEGALKTDEDVAMVTAEDAGDCFVRVGITFFVADDMTVSVEALLSPSEDGAEMTLARLVEYLARDCIIRDPEELLLPVECEPLWGAVEHEEVTGTLVEDGFEEGFDCEMYE